MQPNPFLNAVWGHGVETLDYGGCGGHRGETRGCGMPPHLRIWGPTGAVLGIMARIREVLPKK